ncbi:MAG: hypothetical protein J5671_09790 [Bacteroidaceae bacterium]|nr:hypothetical protein [Bacteroidaceae bacterium]
MKKILRFFLLAVMAMVSYNAMAEDIIWSEDWSGVVDYTSDYKADPAGFNSNYTFTGTVLNDDGTVKSGTKFYGENLAGGQAPELLIAKNGGSFTATIALNGKSGEMMLSFKTNKTLTVDTANKGVTFSEAEKSGNTYILTVTVPEGTEPLVLTFSNSTSSNARFDDAKLYQGTAKKPAGLSWGKASTSVTLGGDYANIPTLQNSNNLPITCTTSNDSVATVTNAGEINVVGAGKAVISAIFEGNDEYEAQTVSFELTVKPAIDDDAKGQKNNPYLMTDEDFLALVLSLDTISKPKSSTIYIKGYITNVEEVNLEYGNATFKIAAVNEKDADMKLKVYRAKYLSKTSFTAEDQIAVGDEVIVCGQIQWFYPEGGEGEPQVAQGGYIYMQNGNTDGIRSIDNGKLTTDNVIYDLSGRRVAKAQKGIYLINGKKVVK